jgi:transposase InsO family protein
LKTGLVLDTLGQALWSRTKTEGLIRQKGRGCQYSSTRYTEKLAGAGIDASVDSPGVSCHNAQVETSNALDRAAAIRWRGPRITVDETECATLE